jgi:transcriptional regulator with XRE-family HTH domain
MRFTEIVVSEFARRRRQNSRYSLRGFARSLGIHHATLSRLLACRRPVASHTIRTIGPRLGLSSEEIESLVAIEDAEFVIEGIRRPSFRPDSRWLATRSGISIDRVNIALHRLIYQRQLRMESRDRWTVSRGEGVDIE